MGGCGGSVAPLTARNYREAEGRSEVSVDLVLLPNGGMVVAGVLQGIMGGGSERGEETDVRDETKI